MTAVAGRSRTNREVSFLELKQNPRCNMGAYRANDDILELAPLTSDDQKLIDAYLQVRKNLDQLAYSPEMNRLIELLRLPCTDESKFNVLQRLLSLRKRSRRSSMCRSRSPTPPLSLKPAT